MHEYHRELDYINNNMKPQEISLESGITGVTDAQGNIYPPPGRKVKIEANHSLNQMLDLSGKFFEPQLASIGLSKEEIERQSLQDLKQSLDRVNEAISKPEFFGTIGLAFDAEVGLLITQNKSKTNIHQVGILPILLERKKLILERIASLKGSKGLLGLKDLISQVEDRKIREQLQEQVESLKEEQEIKEQLEKTEKESLREKNKTFDEIEQLTKKTEMLERRSKVWLSFLERESVATVVGATLLVLITFTQIIAMFIQLESTEIINNAFLLILGYFFGQSSQKNRDTEGGSK